VIAGALAQTLIEHARELGVEMVEHTKVLDMARRDDGVFELLVQHQLTREESRMSANSVVIAIGGGAFEPRKLKVPGEEGLAEDQLTYRLVDKSKVAGKRVVVVGGGDSALESAQAAHEAGAAVTMVQVLERFTGMESNIELVEGMRIPAHFNTRVKELVVEDGRVRAVIAQTKGAAEPLRLECDHVVVNIGAAVNLDAVKRWGIEVEGNLIRVDSHMKTNLEGVFACGDIVTYEGKYKLLLTASKEGAVAANSAYAYVRKPARMTMGDLYT
jgi:thioredoxin reductase (NADPH)